MPQLIASIPYRYNADQGVDEAAFRFIMEFPGTGPRNAIPFCYEGALDTGFSGGISGNLRMKAALEAIGLEAIDTRVKIADQKTHQAWLFEVTIMAVSTPQGPVQLRNPVHTFLMCAFEESDPLVGFGAIALWQVELDSPDGELRVLE